jgi:hypothetical protein
MRHPSLFITVFLFAAAGAIAVSAQTVPTHWSIRAAKDDFTDENYIMIAPLIELPANRAKAPDDPITNEDRIAAINETFGAESISAKNLKQTLAYGGPIDYLVRTTRQVASANTVNQIQRDLSYFLRPFVAIDNGILVIGVTVEGKLLVSVDGDKIEAHSTLPVGDVQWRIDQNAPVDIDPGKNPPLHLPGSTEAVNSTPPAPLPSAESFPPAIEPVAVVRMSKQSAYAAVIGDAANLMLDQMLAGQTIKVRRKPDPAYAQVGATFSSVKNFTLSTEFKALIDKVGLRKNPSTGKWELDPTKDRDRASLLTPAT